MDVRVKYTTGQWQPEWWNKITGEVRSHPVSEEEEVGVVAWTEEEIGVLPWTGEKMEEDGEEDWDKNYESELIRESAAK